MYGYGGVIRFCHVNLPISKINDVVQRGHAHLT